MKTAEAFTIRVAKEKDLKSIYKIEIASFKHPWPEKAFSEILETSEALYVAIDEAPEGNQNVNMVAGFINFMHVADEVHIYNIAVDPALRRLGLGRKLMEFAFSQCDTASLAILEVRVSNSAAVELYLNMGFKIGYTRKKYYENGEDAFCMVKKLK